MYVAVKQCEKQSARGMQLMRQKNNYLDKTEAFHECRHRPLW